MNRKLKNKIKLLGIGAKGDVHDIKYARESWEIKFPLFPDENLIVHKKDGSPGSPLFIGAKIKDKGGNRDYAGKIPAADKFINTIVEKSGIDN